MAEHESDGLHVYCRLHVAELVIFFSLFRVLDYFSYSAPPKMQDKPEDARSLQFSCCRPASFLLLSEDTDIAVLT